MWMKFTSGGWRKRQRDRKRGRERYWQRDTDRETITHWVSFVDNEMVSYFESKTTIYKESKLRSDDIISRSFNVIGSLEEEESRHSLPATQREGVWRKRVERKDILYLTHSAAMLPSISGYCLAERSFLFSSNIPLPLCSSSLSDVSLAFKNERSQK